MSHAAPPAEAAGFQPHVVPGQPLVHSLPFAFPIHRLSQRKYSLGKPDQRELSENLAATQGLAHMIMECNRLFQVRQLLSQSIVWGRGWGLPP